MGIIPVFPGNPRQKHQFIVRIDGFDAAWFEEATIPPVETEIDEFKKVREGNDAQAVKDAMEAFTQKVYQIFGKLYQQEGGEGAPPEGDMGGGPVENDDGTVNTDYDVK